MGRQAYLTRLALGRSAFESLPEEGSGEDRRVDSANGSLPGKDTPETVDILDRTSRDQARDAELLAQTSQIVSNTPYLQQYDRRGHPENPTSRALNRQSRRAINDILATVGVCINVSTPGVSISTINEDKHAFDRSRINAIQNENSSGLLLNSADTISFTLAAWWAESFRQRLQAFRYHAKTPLIHILKSEWNNGNFLRLLYAGAPAALLHQCLAILIPFALDELCEAVKVHLCDKYKSPKTLEALIYLTEITRNSLDAACFIVLAPLEMFAILQRLGLLPSSLWAPHWSTLVPFSASSPLQLPTLPAQLTLHSTTQLVATIALSPLFLSWMKSRITPPVSRKLRAYLRAAVPKPRNPDRYSVQAAKEHYGSDLGLCNALDTGSDERESHSVLEELAKDLQYIGKHFQILSDKLADFFDNNMNRTPGDAADSPRIELWDPPINQSTRSTFTVPSPSTSSSSSSSSSLSGQETPRPSVEITTSTDNGGTVHMSVQVPAPNPNAEVVFENSPPGSESVISNQEGLTNNEGTHHICHRVTALSTYAADSMATHLAAHIQTILFLPFEALFVRSLASSFLSSPRANPAAQAAAARWRAEVYPLGNWSGMGLRGGWRGVGDYVGKMILVTGLEMGFNLVIWQACARVSWQLGRRWHRWGNL